MTSRGEVLAAMRKEIGREAEPEEWLTGIESAIWNTKFGRFFF